MILWLSEHSDTIYTMKQMFFDPNTEEPMWANTQSPYGIIYIPI